MEIEEVEKATKLKECNWLSEKISGNRLSDDFSTGN